MCLNPQKITINKNTIEEKEIEIPCGKCIICRYNKANEWAIRLINFAKYFNKVSFITLTFDNKILLNGNKYANKKETCSYLWNIDYSKDYKTKFIKRLRKKLGKKIYYFCIGEYGEKKHRPHYHMLIFGENFENDRIEIEKSKTGHTQYWSKTLSELWGLGRVTIEDANSKNISYISQYTVKKYKKIDDNLKEKITFSNRGKINRYARRKNVYRLFLNNYLTDEDLKKYRIPKGYKTELKKLANEDKYAEKVLLEYEEITQTYLEKNNYKDKIKRIKIKSEKLKNRIKNYKRDFE